MSKTPRKPMTEHDVDAAEIQAGVDRQKHWLRFGLWLAFIIGCTFVLKTCVESPSKLPSPAQEPSIECSARGNVWHPESVTDKFPYSRIEAYCGPAVPCVEAKK